MNMVFVSALRGAGDMRFVLTAAVTIAAMAVGAAWIGLTYFDLGVYWAWTCVTGWVFMMGATYFARFLHGRWRTLRVIEPEPSAEPHPEHPEPPSAMGAESF